MTQRDVELIPLIGLQPDAVVNGGVTKIVLSAEITGLRIPCIDLLV